MRIGLTEREYSFAPFIKFCGYCENYFVVISLLLLKSSDDVLSMNNIS